VPCDGVLLLSPGGRAPVDPVGTGELQVTMTM
jgi:hypothetical protein